MVCTVSALRSLHSVEADLSRIANRSNAQVDQLVHTAHELREVQDEMKKTLRGDVLQDIMKAVFSSDRDRDFTMSAHEVDNLLLHLRNMPGIRFNEAKFRQVCASRIGEVKIHDVCEIARNLQDDGIPDDQRIFQFEPQSVLRETRNVQLTTKVGMTSEY